MADYGMKKAFVMVGLPGLGKSTAIQAIRSGLHDQPFVYSTDDYIEEIAQALGSTYSEIFSEYIGAATSNMDCRLYLHTKIGSPIIWDQTNLGLKKRRKILGKLKGYHVTCVYIKEPEAGHISDQTEWKNRLENRDGKNIPLDLIAKMRDTLVEPSMDEGFNSIVVYNMYGVLLNDRE